MERVAASNPGDPFQFYFPNTVTNVFHPLLYHYYHLSLISEDGKKGFFFSFGLFCWRLKPSWGLKEAEVFLVWMVVAAEEVALAVAVARLCGEAKRSLV